MFQDMTNATQTKRQPQAHALEFEQEPMVRVPYSQLALINAMSGKLDELSQRVEAIYELILGLSSRRQMQEGHAITSSGQIPEVMQPTFVEEESNVISLLKNTVPQPMHNITQFFEPQPYDPLNGAAVESMVSSQSLQRSREEDHMKVDDHKKVATSSSLAAVSRNDDHNSWKKHDCFILLVEFKCQRMKRCQSSVFIMPGQYAIVQGDRGHDCGVVNQCSEWNAERGCIVREESFDGNIANVVRMKGEMGRVVRVATEEEVERLFGEISRNENIALKTCREIVVRLGLDMDVVDCEYQFDQQKISFYYEASRSIDFRQLNSELFRIFGVRIWLQNVNNAVKNVVPAGAMSREEKTQYQKSGLRPPTFK